METAILAKDYSDASQHDLRHSAASEVIDAGVDLYAVGGVLGHKSSQSTQRYAHLKTSSLQAAIAKIGKRMPKPPNPARKLTPHDATK